MDKNRSHDILHIWNGTACEKCPVCNGELTVEADIIARATEIASENYNPRRNPTLKWEDSMYYCDSGGTQLSREKAEELFDNGQEVYNFKQRPPWVVVASEVPKTATVAIEPPVVEVEAIDSKVLALTELGKNNVVVDTMSFSEDGKSVPTRIKIIPVGEFNTVAYGKVTITNEDLYEMSENVKKKLRAGIPVDIDHDQKAAAGWIYDVSVMADDGMYADVKWTPLGKQKLESEEYKFFSPEFSPRYIDPEHSTRYNNVLIAGSLVNRPMFKELPALTMGEDGSSVQNLTTDSKAFILYIKASDKVKSLTASEKDKVMNLKDILAKEKADRTSDEVKFMFDHLDELTEEERKTEGFNPKAITASDNAPANGGVVLKTGEVLPNQVTISAAEYNILKTGSEKGNLAFSELENLKLTKQVEAFTFGEKGGKYGPAAVAPLVGLLLKMDEGDREVLIQVLENLPDKKLFGEIGSAESTDKNQALDQLTVKANELHQAEIAQGNKTYTFGEAMSRVARENPELRKETYKPLKINSQAYGN